MYVNPETCEKCPHRHSHKGCPCWIDASWGYMEQNVATGENRLITGCFYQVIPKLMVHVVQAAGKPAAALESWRNTMDAGFDRLIQALPPPPGRLIEHG